MERERQTIRAEKQEERRVTHRSSSFSSRTMCPPRSIAGRGAAYVLQQGALTLIVPATPAPLAARWQRLRPGWRADHWRPWLVRRSRPPPTTRHSPPAREARRLYPDVGKRCGVGSPELVLGGRSQGSPGTCRHCLPRGSVWVRVAVAVMLRVALVSRATVPPEAMDCAARNAQCHGAFLATQSVASGGTVARDASQWFGRGVAAPDQQGPQLRSQGGPNARHIDAGKSMGGSPEARPKPLFNKNALGRP